jgi:predicted porin
LTTFINSNPGDIMKRTLTVLAILAATSHASAQSSITLFGTVDATLAHGSGSLASKTQLTNSGMKSSQIGFRGTEDLGGGMSASFWLEAGMSNDDGQGASSSANNQLIAPFNPVTGANAPVRAGTQGLTFNRRSTLSLAGSWGELRLGRDYVPSFWNIAADPFSFNGVGQTVLGAAALGAPTVQVRASNSVAYLLPANLGGFYGHAQYYLGENLSNAGATRRDGTGANVRLGYASGPINAAIGTARTHYATGDLSMVNVMGQYDFGVARLIANYQRETIDAPVKVTARGGLIGTRIPLGAHEARFSYSTYRNDSGAHPGTTKLAAGYIYNLSKRTALYATYARVKNRGGAAISLNGSSTAANASSSGFDLGIRHDF